MKFNHNQNQRSFTIAALLSLCAIAASITTTAIKPLSKAEVELPTIEQQERTEEKSKQFKPDNNGSVEAWKEVEVDKDWDGILGSESEEEILLAGSRSF